VDGAAGVWRDQRFHDIVLIYEAYMAIKSRKRSPASKTGAVLVRFKRHDSAYGVTRATVQKLAKTMRLNVSDVVHVALAQCARTNLPRYEMDNGPLTAKQHESISELTRDTRATYRETESLFGRGSGAKDNGREDIRTVSRSR
jgi:hypothetical protein